MPATGREDREPLLDPAQAKALAAEKDIAVIRLVVILFNVGIYYTLLDRDAGVPWLADTISVVATTYALLVVLTRPYERFPVLRAALFTALGDGVLIVLWIHATGGYASPFHLLWFLSLMAVAFRYEWKATILATLLYMGGYAGLLAYRGELVANGAEVGIRLVYVGLAGAVGSLLAYESAQVFEARGRLEREMVAARQESARAELEHLRDVARFKTEFINAAAHELNTPLTPLRLQLHALRSAAAGHDRERALQIMERNVDRVSVLVGDMLDAARLQSGKLEIVREPVDLATLVRDAADTYAGQAQARGIDLSVAGPAPLVARLDGKRVSQILYNLLSNAVKYTPDGGRVQVRYHLDREGVVEIEVTDSGLGLTRDQADRLFLPFSQVHRDVVSVPGTGLGLFISRGIAERHGGMLTASSEGPGKGSRFVCRLPTHGPQEP